MQTAKICLKFQFSIHFSEKWVPLNDVMVVVINKVISR